MYGTKNVPNHQPENTASRKLHVLSNMLKHQNTQLHATSRRLSAGQDDLTQVLCMDRRLTF